MNADDELGEIPALEEQPTVLPSEEYELEVAADADEAAPIKKKRKKKKGKKVVIKEVMPRWARLALAVAALAIVACASVATLQWKRADDATTKSSDRKAAESVAGEFTQTLFTWDSANPTGSLDRLKELATVAYQPKVDSARQTAVSDPASTQDKVSMSAQVLDVFITEVTNDAAQAVSQATWLLNAKGQTLPLDLYLKIELKRVGADWRVNDVSALTARQPNATTATTAPGATTTTTTTTTTSN